MTHPDAPPPMTPQEAAARLERDYQADSDYLAELDKRDRHTPAPTTYIRCRHHGLVRGLLGCPRCSE